MGWDRQRPVPWRRLLREWAIYVAIMSVVFLVVLPDQSYVGLAVGLLASGPIYLSFGYVMAKFGYQRTTLRQARVRARAGAGTSADATTAQPRPKPPPTKRTGGASTSRGRPTSTRRR